MAASRHPFTPGVLMYTPALPGRYALWDRDTVIFIDEARAPRTLLDCLMDHYCGRAQPSRATHFAWQLEPEHAEVA
jgi:hypothetical protein